MADVHRAPTSAWRSRVIVKHSLPLFSSKVRVERALAPGATTAPHTTVRTNAPVSPTREAAAASARDGPAKRSSTRLPRRATAADAACARRTANSLTIRRRSRARRARHAAGGERDRARLRLRGARRRMTLDAVCAGGPTLALGAASRCASGDAASRFARQIFTARISQLERGARLTRARARAQPALGPRPRRVLRAVRGRHRPTDDAPRAQLAQAQEEELHTGPACTKFGGERRWQGPRSPVRVFKSRNRSDSGASPGQGPVPRSGAIGDARGVGGGRSFERPPQIGMRATPITAGQDSRHLAAARAAWRATRARDRGFERCFASAFWAIVVFIVALIAQYPEVTAAQTRAALYLGSEAPVPVATGFPRHPLFVRAGVVAAFVAALTIAGCGARRARRGTRAPPGHHVCFADGVRRRSTTWVRLVAYGKSGRRVRRAHLLRNHGAQPARRIRRSEV